MDSNTIVVSCLTAFTSISYNLNYCRQRNCFDLLDLISAVKCMAARFQSYEYTLSEIFMTCGTQLSLVWEVIFKTCYSYDQTTYADSFDGSIATLR